MSSSAVKLVWLILALNSIRSLFFEAPRIVHHATCPVSCGIVDGKSRNSVIRVENVSSVPSIRNSIVNNQRNYNLSSGGDLVNDSLAGCDTLNRYKRFLPSWQSQAMTIKGLIVLNPASNVPGKSNHIPVKAVLSAEIMANAGCQRQLTCRAPFGPIGHSRDTWCARAARLLLSLEGNIPKG